MMVFQLDNSRLFLVFLCRVAMHLPKIKKWIMANQHKSNAISEQMILPLALINGIVIRNGYLINSKWWWILFITLPLLLWPVAHRFITIKIMNHAKNK